MAIFTSAIIAGFLGLEATFFTAGIALALNVSVGVAASLGLSYAAKAIAGTPQTQTQNDNFGVQGTLQADGEVPRSFNLGFSVTAGSLVYANYHGGNSETPNAYMTQVIAISDLPSGPLLEFWVNDEKMTLPDGGLAGGDQGTDAGYAPPEYVKPRGDAETIATHLWIKYYDGTQTTADPYMVGTVSSSDRPYEATRVGVGVAYVVVTYLENDKLWTGFPQFKFAGAKVKLYDPSKDTTVGGSGSHLYSDPTTWGGDGDDYPAVQIYNILRGIYYGGTWLYGLQNFSDARLPVDNWIAQITKCRTGITGENGTEPTYRAGGQINVNTQPVNAIESFLTTCQGRLSEIGGFYKLHLGAPDASVAFAIFDDDILSSEVQTFRPFFALSDSVNGIQGSYPDPAQGWASVPAPAYYRTDLEVLDGNRRLMANPTFDFVPYAAQVQRLQKSAIEEAQRARTHTFTLPPQFWTLEPGDYGQWTSTRNGYSSKQFRVDAIVDKANLDVSVSITEVDPSDYSWTHSTDFKQTSSSVGVVFSRPAPQDIVDFDVQPFGLLDSDGINRRPAIRLTWDGDMPGVVGIQYEVRLASDNSDVTKGRTDQLAAAALIISHNLIPNTEYEVRAQYLPSAPREMLWSSWLNVTTPNILIGVVEFDEALSFQVQQAFDDVAGTINNIEQLISSLASTDIARNWLDKKTIRTEYTSVTQTLSTTLTAKITDVSTVASQETGAVAARTLALESTVNDTNTGVVANATNVANLTAAIDLDKGHPTAMSIAISNLNSAINNSTTGLSASASNINTLIAQVDLDPDHPSAMSVQINALKDVVNDSNHGVVATSNAVSTLISQVNLDPNHPSAISSKLDNFSTTIGNHSTSISQLTGSIDGNTVTWSILASIDGSTGGIVFDGARTSAGVIYNFRLKGDVIIDGTVAAKALSVASLSAITADLGTITAGRMHSIDGLMDIDLANRYIIFSDNT